MQPHKRWQCLLGPCHVVLHANAACGAALDAVQHCGNKSAGGEQAELASSGQWQATKSGGNIEVVKGESGEERKEGKEEEARLETR